jgi:hypothetical protein
MSSDVLVFVSNKAEAAAGPSQRVTNNLSFFYLAPLLKVAREVLNKDLFLHTTNRLALALERLAISISPIRPISRPTPSTVFPFVRLPITAVGTIPISPTSIATLVGILTLP